MDRNTIIGLVLIMGLIMTWSFFFQPDPITPTTTTTEETISDLPDPDIATIDTLNGEPLALVEGQEINDSLRKFQQQSRLQDEFGDFLPAAEGESRQIHVITDKFDLNLQTLGATFTEIYLRDYVTFDSNKLAIYTDNPENRFSLEFVTRGDRIRGISTSDLYFETNVVENEIRITGDETKEVSFKAKVDEDRYIEFIYTFHGGTYDIGFELDFVGMDKLFRDSNVQMLWTSHLPVTEKNLDEMRNRSAIFYRDAGEVEDLGMRKTETVNEKEHGRSVEWVGFVSQFFTHTLMFDEENPVESFDYTVSVPVGDKYMKKMEAALTLPAEHSKMMFYAGPMEFFTLKSYDNQMQDQLNLGWLILKPINAWVIIPVFHFMEKAIGNYGIIILILALLIKLVVFPLTYKTYISSAKMRIVNQTPEMKEMEEKYKKDQTKMQQEKMAFYRKLGVSPFGGCVPMILQYPILISMFYFFPQSIELRQKAFLWADDLSTYDSIFELPFEIPFYGDHVSLFCLLMAVSIFGYTLINQQTQGNMGAANNPMFKYLPYIMPVVLLGVLNSYSSGLSFYYLVSNVISIGQTVIVKYFIDDKKLLAQIHEGSKKKGKSKKKGRLESWMEKQQKKQREMQKQNRKK